MGIHAKRGWLYVTFYADMPGRRHVQCQEATRLKDTKANRKIAEDMDKAIRYALKFNKFSYLEYFPNGAKAKLFRRSTGGILFSEWWEEWMSEKTLRDNTERGWSSSYKVHIGPVFGRKVLSEITEHDILVFRKSLEGTLKPNTINDKIIKPLCMCLLKAKSRGMIDHYPCEEVPRLTETKPEIDPFSFEEIRALLGFLETYKNPIYHDLVLIWSRTGLRPGEMCALKWSNIDWFNQKAMIRETMHKKGQEGPPKTVHSVRDVDLRPKVLEAFRRQEARTGLQGTYVWMTGDGEPFTDAYLRKRFRHLLRLAKIKHRPPKQLRHTFATLHLAAGEQPDWIRRMMGHSNVRITLERYTRYVRNLTREDGSAFEKVMDGNTEAGKNAREA